MGGSDVLTGFDGSNWQAGSYAGGGGFAFGLAKATEGAAYADPSFRRHFEAIRRGGLIAGAYAFARPELGAPEPQADFFVAVVRPVVGDLRGLLLALDLEVGSGPLAWWRDRFCDRVEAIAGQPCWWYSYGSFVATRALNTGGTRYPFWLAWPDSNGRLPAFAFGLPQMQQWGLASVPGIGGMVDANRFFGSLADLRALTVGGSVAPPEDLVLEDVMPLTIERPDGSGEDQFAVMPDGKLHHVFFAADGSDPQWDDDCPGSWATVSKARWFGGVLVVWAYGWQAGKGGSLSKVWWSADTGQWSGPAFVAGAA